MQKKQIKFKILSELLCQQTITKQGDIDFIINNWDWLRANRLESALLLKNGPIADYLDVQQKFNDCQTKFLKTLELIENTLTDIPYFVIRSSQDIKYVTYDLDIVIKREHFWLVQKLFKDKGYEIGNHNSSLSGRIINSQCNILGKDILPIDIHIDFTWMKSRYFDVSKIFEKEATVDIFGKRIKTWAVEYEILARCASLLSEKFFLSHLEFFSLQKLISQPGVDFSFIEEQAKKYYWHDEYRMLMNKLKEVEEKNINLPRFFSIKECFKIFSNRFKCEKNIPVIPILYFIYRRLLGKF